MYRCVCVCIQINYTLLTVIFFPLLFKICNKNSHIYIHNRFK